MSTSSSEFRLGGDRNHGGRVIAGDIKMWGKQGVRGEEYTSQKRYLVYTKNWTPTQYRSSLAISHGSGVYASPVATKSLNNPFLYTLEAMNYKTPRFPYLAKFPLRGKKP